MLFYYVIQKRALSSCQRRFHTDFVWFLERRHRNM